MSKNRKSFILHKSFYEPVKNLSDSELGVLFRLIFEYHEQNEQNEHLFDFQDMLKKASSQVQMAFAFFRNQLDHDNQKYSDEVEKRRLAGIKSGEARRLKTNEARTKRTLVQSVEQNEHKTTKRSDNVNDNDIIISSLRSEIKISDYVWNDFLEHRKKTKSPATLAAQKLILEKLKIWQSEGENPEQILKNSIENGWKGVFKPQAQQKPKQIHGNFNKQNYSEGTDGFIVD